MATKNQNTFDVFLGGEKITSISYPSQSLDVTSHDSEKWKDLIGKSWSCEITPEKEHNYEMQFYRRTKTTAFFRSKDGHRVTAVLDMELLKDLKSGYKNGEWVNCKFET